VKRAVSVATGQPPCEARDVVRNALSHARTVREAGSRLVLFPELSLTGYELDAAPVPPTDAALAPIIAACASAGSVALAGAPVEEDGRRFIAALRIDGSGAAVAYRKTHLGGAELERLDSGDGPTVIELDGWRIGIGICKDTGVAEHTEGTARLGVDLYVAGLAHLPEELEEQDARGRRIAVACGSYVAFASFAGATGGGYEETAGTSTIWSPDGSVIARAGSAPGEIIRAELEPLPAGELARGVSAAAQASASGRPQDRRRPA
jgi:predicted amidohydrolase